VTSSLARRPEIFCWVFGGRTPRSLMLFDPAVDYGWCGCWEASGSGAGDASVHPLSGRSFEFVNRGKSWQSDRVYFFGDAGELACFPGGEPGGLPGPGLPGFGAAVRAGSVPWMARNPRRTRRAGPGAARAGAGLRLGRGRARAGRSRRGSARSAGRRRRGRAVSAWSSRGPASGTRMYVQGASQTAYVGELSRGNLLS
jgi:hypothetical protein